MGTAQADQVKQVTVLAGRRIGPAPASGAVQTHEQATAGRAGGVPISQ